MICLIRNCNLGDLEAPFRYLGGLIFAFGWPCWWSMGPQGHQRGHLGVQGWIFIDFWWILRPSWESILISLLVFFRFGVTNLQCQFWGVFFSGFGWGNDTRICSRMCWKHCSDVAFVRFHFFTYLVNWMISSRLLDVCLAAFWVHWAHFFWFLRVWGVGLEIDDFLGIPWRDPRWANTVRLWLKGARWAH